MDCFPDYIKNEFIHKKRVDCPKCGKIIHNDEIKHIIGKEQWGRTLQESSVSTKYCNEDEEVYKCECGNIVDLYQQDLNYKIRDDNGEIIPKEAAEHLAKFKVK